jgi:ribose 1,5-bisphosphokinase PhnN
VIAHGAGRYTKDIDLLIDDAPENVVRVKRAMSVLADNAAADISETDIREFVVVRVADEILVDLMGRACGLSYADVVEDVEHLDLGGVVVPVASPATLIRTKHTHRPQDAIDCSFLEGVIRDRAAGR